MGFDFENFDEKEKQIANIILQGIKDELEGGITSQNLSSFRNTYIINAQDSLDADYPMYVHFNIISEMIKIVSVKVSFWILNYRAYSKAADAGGGQTSSSVSTPSGGGSTSGSGGAVTPTSSSFGGDHAHWINVDLGTDGSPLLFDPTTGHLYVDAPALYYDAKTETQDIYHTHTVSVPNHTHTTPPHTHPAHSHTIDDHTHDAAYGIYEEETSPKIKFYISENEGVSYNDVFFGGYDTKKSDLEITSLLTGVGSKLIKFTSDLRARLSVQIEIKLDIKAR